MQLRSWGPRYHTNIGPIDDQHRTLFELIHRLNSSMATGQSRSLRRDVLDELHTYVQHHFSMEEQLLLRHGYPDLEAHRAEHLQFAKRLLAIRDRLRTAREVTVAIDTASLLNDWLLTHIEVADMRYARFLRERAATSPR